MLHKVDKGLEDEQRIDDFLYVKDAAIRLGVHPHTLRRWEKIGKIIVHRHPINGYRMYLKTDLTEILKRIYIG